MKRINALLVALAIGIAAISLWSCNANDSVEMRNEVRTVEIESSVPEIVRVLEAYNASLAEEMGPQTRLSQDGWRIAWNDAKGAFKGAKAGYRYGSLFSPSGAIAGAVVGGILNGAVASAAAWIETQMVHPLTSVYDNLVTTGDIYEIDPLYAKYVKISDEQVAAEIERMQIAFASDSVFLQVGALHNLLCDELKRPVFEVIIEPIDGPFIGVNGGGLLPPGSDDDGTMVPGGFLDPVLSSSEFRADYRLLVEDSLNNPLDIGFDSNDTSTATSIANLFLQACDTNVRTMANLYRVVNNYYAMVCNSSELTQDEKDCLICMFAVAEYSAKYWGLK